MRRKYIRNGEKENTNTLKGSDGKWTYERTDRFME